MHDEATILFILVLTILLGNDEATRLFVAVQETRKICIDRTTMFTVVDLPVSTC